MSIGRSATPQAEVEVRSVCELIAGVLDTTPHAIALSDGEQNVSFWELDAMADHFAGHLQTHGVLPGDTVAICMERSILWVAAALAVMRCGAAYLPLDLEWPDARLQSTLEDSGATLLVARRERSVSLQTPIAVVDPALVPAGTNGSSSFRRVEISMGDLAYVIYTSGSSGSPKGVEVTHANLAHLLQWHRDAFKITSRDRAGSLAGLGFDASVWEIWPNLCAGATLCLASEEVRSSPHKIYDWILRERITIAFIPTVHVESLTSMFWPRTTTLRLMLTGGDTLHHAPSSALPFDLVNNYGPAECTVVTTSGVVEPGTSAKPSIGRPIDGAEVYLLDEFMQCVPVGAVGEIYIGGAGVASGYRNLPQLTAQRFFLNPFTDSTHARMYRTGDFAVRRTTGELEFRGRRDRQVKLRGQRIELDEIDAVLNRHPAVRFATAILDDPEGKAQLAAYVLLREGAEDLTEEELQQYTHKSLPAYMVPEVFARIERVPDTVHGKVNLESLRSLNKNELLRGPVRRTPVSSMEEKLLSIIRDLLEDPRVTVRDNFYMAGGHSLLGMQLILRLQSSFGVCLSLQDLFQSPTVEGLAKVIQDIPAKPALPSGVLEVLPKAGRKIIFWIHYQNVELAKAIGDDMTFLSVVLTPDDLRLLGEAPTLQQVARCIVPKILQTQSEEPYVIGGLCIGGVLAYEVAHQLRSAGKHVSLLVLLDPPTPDYLKAGPNPTVDLSYLRYLLPRAMRLGPKVSAKYFQERLVRHVASILKRKPSRTSGTVAQSTIEVAAFNYVPAKYGGNVLLLLASERPPSVNFLPGWQAVATAGLNAQYINAHHRDLLGPKTVSAIADAIKSRLLLTASGAAPQSR